MHKDVLADLVLFYSSMEKKMITLDEYIAKMGEEQKFIYYAAGESVEKNRYAAANGVHQG